MATNFFAQLKSRSRFALAIFFSGACAYAIDRWFFSGLLASKWIGLSEYEQAMKELQKRSLIWGDVALVLGIVGYVLILPPWPVRSKSEARHGILTATPEGNIWREYFGQCVFRAGIILVGTFGLAVMIPLSANFLQKFLSAW